MLQGSAELDADSALPRHWLRNFFLTHVCVEGQENEEALGRLSVRSMSCPSTLKLWSGTLLEGIRHDTVPQILRSPRPAGVLHKVLLRSAQGQGLPVAYRRQH